MKFLSFLIIFVVVLWALGFLFFPHFHEVKRPNEAMSAEHCRIIALAMARYAADNGGKYPSGKTSTEIFQKLLDEGYVTDSSLFCFPGGYAGTPGKVYSKTSKLTADNVSFDATVGLTTDSPSQVPVVFLTGFDVAFAPGASAKPLLPVENTRLAGIAVAYKDGTKRFIEFSWNQTIHAFVPSDFASGNNHFEQVRP